MKNKENIGLPGLDIYVRSLELSYMAWQICQSIPKSLQYHIGNQFIDCVDSIGANIAEGFGRFHFKDNLRFYYYSRGSLFEAKHWIKLLYERNLITLEQFENFRSKLEQEGIKLNNFINATKNQIQTPQ